MNDPFLAHPHAALFGRACAVAVSGKRDVDLGEEVAALRAVLVRKLAGALTLLENDVDGIAAHPWFGRADARRFVTALKPKLQAAARDTEALLKDVVTLQARPGLWHAFACFLSVFFERAHRRGDSRGLVHACVQCGESVPAP